MNRTHVRRRRGRRISLPRLALLVLLAFGVAGMHTLGHDAGNHAAAAHPSVASGAASTTLAFTMAGPDNTHDHMSPAGAPSSGGGLDLNLFSVCLAVLGGFVLVLGLALRGTGSLWQAPGASALFPGGRGGRGPPAPSAGLRLRRVAVLRI
ncbi:DUF6153 family protein [Micromonospora sp. B11E3]|uniref:DUF6153 family protein n=1 Tax=Micromonospora sp. B11E3 TaxID=3153562 RepID=UPI00325E4FBE